MSTGANSQTTSAKRVCESGFTLVELIVAIVLVGILTAVAIVGLSGLNKTGSKSQCSTIFGAAQSAAATYYATNNIYPTTFTALTSGSGAVLTLPAGVTASGATLTASNWTITLSSGGTTSPPTYTKTGACL